LLCGVINMKRCFYWWRAFFSMLVFNFYLKKRGLTGMFKIYSQEYEKCALVDYSNYTEKDLLAINKNMELMISTCVSACSMLPFEAKCIHQSFFLYKIIRKKCGVPVSLVIGVSPFPFNAHAWLMLNERNFYEAEYETSKYSVMLRSENYYEVG